MDDNNELSNESLELSEEAKERLVKFDSTKPLVINTTEIAKFSHLSGRFVFKRPTLGQQITIGVNAAKLRQNSDLDTATDNVAYILATFSVVCAEKPKDFSFADCYDFDPIFELYNRYMEWINFFRLKLQGNQK